MDKIREFLSGPAKELVREPSVRKVGQLIAQNATSPAEIRRLISVWKRVDRSCLIAEGVTPAGIVDEVLIGVAEGLVVPEPREPDIDALFPMLSEVRRLRFVDSDWLGHVVAELEGFASAMFAQRQAATPIVRAARAVSMSIADKPVLLAAIIDAIDHVLHDVAPGMLARLRLVLGRKDDLLNERARAVSEADGFLGLVGAVGIQDNFLIRKEGVEEKKHEWLLDLDAYHIFKLSDESRDRLCGWIRRGVGESNVCLEEAVHATSAGSRYERLAIMDTILTAEIFRKVGLTENQVTQHFVELAGCSWFSALGSMEDWVSEASDRNEIPHPCIGFVCVNGLIDWDGAIEYCDLEPYEGALLTKVVSGMLALGLSSVADALCAVHFVLEVLGPRRAIPSIGHFIEIIERKSGQLPLLIGMVQSSEGLEKVLGYTKAKQCATLRSLVPARVEGQKVVRLVVYERSQNKHRAADFDFSGFPEGLAGRIREYLEMIPRSSPRCRPSPTQCEALVNALGKMLEWVLREYVPYITSSQRRVQELGLVFRDNWEQSSSFIFRCLAELHKASNSGGMVDTFMLAGVTAEEKKSLYEAINLRNKASHANGSRESIRWGDVVRMEEILLDGDLLRRLVTASIVTESKKS